MKKIFALVMVVTVLGAFMAGCSKPADTDTAGTAGTATAGAATAGTTGATATTTGK